MSQVQILSGGTDARYTVKLDWGEAQRTALLDALATGQTTINAKIFESQVKYDAGKAAEAAAALNLANIVEQFITDQAGLTPEEQAAGIGPFQKIYDLYLKDLFALRARNSSIYTAHQRLLDAKASILKRTAYWTEFVATETRAAWCCDYTESASGFCGGVHIPGESDLVLIAPGGRAPAPTSDGLMSARELMSPEQAYFNAAILPGWQVDKPTYRWGTITSIDEDANRVDLDLSDQTSSADRLSINGGRSRMSAVPVNYMECNCLAFSVGSRVVVELLGQSWDTPEVIGFLDNPRPCPPEFVGNIPTGGGIIPSKGYPNGLNVSESFAANWRYGWPDLVYSVSQGGLPAGLTLDPATGVLSGVCTTQGVSTVVFRCTDRGDKFDDSNTFTITIGAPYLAVTVPPVVGRLQDTTFSGSLPYVRIDLVQNDGFVIPTLPAGYFVKVYVETNEPAGNIGSTTKYYPWFVGPVSSTPYAGHWLKFFSLGETKWMSTWPLESGYEGQTWATGVKPGTPGSDPADATAFANYELAVERVVPRAGDVYAYGTSGGLEWWAFGGVDEDGASGNWWYWIGAFRIEIYGDAACTKLATTITGSVDMGRPY